MIREFTLQLFQWKEFTQSQSLRSIAALLASNFLGFFVAGVFFLVASRNFTLEVMGFYSVAISIQWVFVGLLGTGLSVATVRLSTSRLTNNESPLAAGIGIFAIILTAGISTSLAILNLFLFSSFNIELLLPGGILSLAILWAGSRAMLDCIRSGLLAQQKYNHAALIVIISAICGLTSLTVIYKTGPLMLNRMLLAHVLGLSISAILALFFLIPLWRKGVQFSLKILKELLKYSFWPALSEGIKLLQMHFGPLLLVLFSNSAQAGLFSLGRYPAYLFEVLTVSLFQFWLPEIGRQKGGPQIIHFLKNQMRLVVCASLIMIFGALICCPFLKLLGSNFASAANLFLLSALDFSIFILIRPIESIFHGLYKPHLEFLLRIIRLPLLLGIAIFLIPYYDAFGMAWAYIISNVLTAGVAFFILHRYLVLKRIALKQI